MERDFQLISGDVLRVAADDDTFGAFVGTVVDVNALQRAIVSNFTAPVFRIFVLHSDEKINWEIPAEDIRSGGSYSENYQNGTRRTLSFSLYNEEEKYTPSINMFWVGTKLRLDLGLQLLSGAIVWFQKGIFVVTSASPSKTPEEHIVSISAQDKFHNLEQGPGVLTSSYVIPTQSRVVGVLQSTLYTDTGAQSMLDPKNFLLQQSLTDRRIEAEIAKNAGDTRASLLLDVAEQISCECFYNSLGQLVLAPLNQVTNDVNKPILCHYDTVNGDISGLEFSLDFGNVVNRVVIIGTSLSGGTFTHVAVNDNADSPLCYQRIGYRTGPIITDTNIYSLALAKERAEYELRQQLILKTSVNVNVLFNPFLEVNNLVTLSDDFFDLRRERFLVQGLSCPLDYSGAMSLQLTNIKNLSFVS